jgi:uncharacterized membrane protein
VDGSSQRIRPGWVSLASAVAALSIVALLGIVPPSVLAAASPSISTPYPAVAVAPGTKVSFDLTVSSPTAQTVRLAANGLPDGWTATFRGGGYQVSAVTAGSGAKASQVTLEIDVPATASPGRYPVIVRGVGTGGTGSLALDIAINPSAGGEVSLTPDFPSLSGAAGTTFTFNLTLANDTPEDRTFAVSASGPEGWQVTARPSGSSQASSVPVKASSSATITVTADPPSTAPADTYPIDVKATEGGNEVDTQLSVEVIGQYQLNLTTPDQRLSTTGTAGSATQFQLQVDNAGSAPLQNVKLTASPPTGWKVTFAPADTIASIDAGSSQTVTAQITPSDQAIAGDYVVSFTATASQATDSQDIRVTVETSLTWAIVGIGLIVLAFVVLGLVFRRFGRR